MNEIMWLYRGQVLALLVAPILSGIFCGIGGFAFGRLTK